MKKSLTACLVFFAFVLFPASVFCQEKEPPKYALVIGNGRYDNLSKLANPANDANDIADVLDSLGFSVDRVIDGNLVEMQDAVTRLKNRLSVESSSYGFFFYAGHGVQSGGENYLVPADANIRSENYLQTHALAVQTMLDELNDAGNALNVVVMDACRDNPFGWSRSGTRGLAIVSRQPADSIIVYATSAGQGASDGDGENGLFTSWLLRNLATPGLEIKEVFNRTGADVSKYSNREQIPAIYNQFFGSAYLAGMPAAGTDAAVQPVTPVPQALSVLPGRNDDRKDTAGLRYWSLGASVGSSFSEPWLIGTARGTVAPFNYSFLEIGFDVGIVSGYDEIESYYSLYPYVNYAFYYPLMDFLSLYAGAGAGFFHADFAFTGGVNAVPVNTFTANLTAGVILFDMITVSYTMRTNFSDTSGKVSAGYAYRFK